LGADLVELDCGHCPHVEATEQFVKALDASCDTSGAFSPA